MPNDLDITVVGQRRTNSTLSFPGRFDGPPGDGSPVVVPDMGDPDYVPPVDRCSDPAHKVDFKADAAAALAAKQFAVLAGMRTPPEDLNVREWGAYLYLDGIGQVQIGIITHGDPFGSGGVGTVALDMTGINPASIIGSIHSHSVGNHLPSVAPPGDSRSDIGHLAGMVANNQNPATRLYIVAKNFVNPGQTQYNQIRVYNTATAQNAVDTLTPGPEVNPDSQPCPL